MKPSRSRQLAAPAALPLLVLPKELKELQDDPGMSLCLYAWHSDLAGAVRFLQGAQPDARDVQACRAHAFVVGYLDAFERLVRPLVAPGETPLMPEGSKPFLASDGSAVAIGADGVVQHSAPASVLLELGVKTATEAPLSRGATLPSSGAATAHRKGLKALPGVRSKGGDRPE